MVTFLQATVQKSVTYTVGRSIEVCKTEGSATLSQARRGTELARRATYQ